MGRILTLFLWLLDALRDQCRAGLQAYTRDLRRCVPSLSHVKDLGTVLFKWAALVMLLVAGVVMASSPAAGDPVLQAIVTLQRCVRVVQCGLILFLLIFSKYLGVSWRQQSFGIALGFGSLAAVELTLVALHASAHLSPVRSSLFNFAAYDVGILIWLTYGLISAQARVVAADAP